MGSIHDLKILQRVQAMKSNKGSFIMFYPGYRETFGSVTAGLLAGALLGWKKGFGEGDFSFTRQEISQRTGLSADEQLGAEKRLRALGVLEVRQGGMPRRTIYRVDWPRLAAVLEAGGTVEVTPPNEPKIATPVVGNSAAQSPEIRGTEPRKFGRQSPEIRATVPGNSWHQSPEIQPPLNKEELEVKKKSIEEKEAAPAGVAAIHYVLVEEGVKINRPPAEALGLMAQWIAQGETPETVRAAVESVRRGGRALSGITVGWVDVELKRLREQARGRCGRLAPEAAPPRASQVVPLDGHGRTLSEAARIRTEQILRESAARRAAEAAAAAGVA